MRFFRVEYRPIATRGKDADTRYSNIQINNDADILKEAEYAATRAQGFYENPDQNQVITVWEY